MPELKLQVTDYQEVIKKATSPMGVWFLMLWEIRYWRASAYQAILRRLRLAPLLERATTTPQTPGEDPTR